jgi:threonine/homoserine/homoserine lactone efflux protein
MKEAIIATFVFWSAFVFSIGPFWIAVMDAARHTSFATLYKNYIIYSLVGWFPINALIGAIVGTIGVISEDIYTALYFVGAAVIFRLAWKTVAAKPGESEGFDFNWKMMTLLSWSNPKVWTTIPAGFLAATYTDSLAINIVVFFLIGTPLFLFGVYLWGMIGRQGAKIARDKVGYFNAALLTGFGIYLLYQGIQLVTVSV